MRTAFFLFLAALFIGAVFAAPTTAPVPAPAPIWFTEQLTYISVDSNNFITGGQAGHVTVTILEFTTKTLCEEWVIANSSLHFGVDQPMGTGSYFARIGATFSDCRQK